MWQQNGSVKINTNILNVQLLCFGERFNGLFGSVFSEVTAMLYNQREARSGCISFTNLDREHSAIRAMI